MYERSVKIMLDEALKVSPCVLLSGARQVGKSTLCISLNQAYRVFDNLSEREAASVDAVGYIALLPKPITLDEIQKVPTVLEGIKIDIDKERINGNFLLTGSANVLDMKQAKDTLAGRIIEISMWPLSQKELNNKANDNIIDTLFKLGIEGVKTDTLSYINILQAIIDGGYPEIQKIDSIMGKSLWYNSYISTYVERDIRDVGELRDISAFIRFFNIIAPRSCGLVNKSDLASDSNLTEVTVNNYLSMLEMIYQITLLPAYSSNISKRFIKSSKLFMTDSGVYCHLLGIQSVDELINSNYKGDVIETFVFTELVKHLSYSVINAKMYHYRTNDKKEIDFIIERGNTLLAIEVKSSQSIKKDAFKHIIDFQNKSSKNILGIVFYGGDSILSFSDEEFKRYAVPLNCFF